MIICEVTCVCRQTITFRKSHVDLNRCALTFGSCTSSVAIFWKVAQLLTLNNGVEFCLHPVDNIPNTAVFNLFGVITPGLNTAALSERNRVAATQQYNLLDRLDHFILLY